MNIITSGSGTITVRSGVGGNRQSQIRLPNLMSDSDIHVSAGGSASWVLVSGTLSGANIAIDAAGSVTVEGGARLVAGGDGTSLIGVGTVSLTAGEDIGSDTERIEITGVTDLILDLDGGDFFVSGSDGAGGPGGALSSLTLSLAPDGDGDYVVENFAGQAFDFGQDAFGDYLVIREITSASLLDLSITTRDAGIVIGGAGIQLAGESNVTLNSHRGIEEADFDDGARVVVAEITTDGRLTLVANTDIGGNGVLSNGVLSNGLLDVAARASGVSVLQATSTGGAVRVNGLDALRVEGSGIKAAGGGILASASALTIAADIETSDDMTLSAGKDGARAGDDLTITGGAVVTLNSTSAAVLSFSAGDNIAFDGGRIQATGQTSGADGHRVELLADLEKGGSDGVVGQVSQTGVGVSVAAGHVSVVAGGGIGANAALRTAAATLSVDNSSNGDVQVANQGDVTLLGSFRNAAAGGTLTLVNDNGAVNTGTANVVSNAGLLTLEAQESDPMAAPGNRARITIGATGLHSTGGEIVVNAAGSIDVNGHVISGGADATIQAGLDRIAAAPAAIGALRIAENIDTGAGKLSLGAGGAIDQLAGRIAAASLRSHSGGATTLDGRDNAIAGFAATAGGDVSLANSVALAIGTTEVDGSLRIENAEAVSVTDLVAVRDTATLMTGAGNIDGAGGRIVAKDLDLDSAAGIGVGAVLETEVSRDISLQSRGVAGDGDIRIQQLGELATSQLQLLATDTASAQTVSIAASDVLTVDKDPVDTPNLQFGEALELDAARIALAEKISG